MSLGRACEYVWYIGYAYPIYHTYSHTHTHTNTNAHYVSRIPDIPHISKTYSHALSVTHTLHLRVTPTLYVTHTRITMCQAYPTSTATHCNALQHTATHCMPYIYVTHIPYMYPTCALF